MRLIGLDWGTVRVGVAMTDEEQKMAFPLQQTFESAKAIQEIQKLLDEYEIEKVVIGLPLSLKGEETESSRLTKKFAEKIEDKLKIPVEFIDERFSSVASTQALHDQNIKEAEQRHIKDNVAAALLLQQFIDNKK